MDILLTHAYYLYEDPHELAVMKPYPPLGLLYISAHLKARGFDSPYLKAFVVARINPLRFIKGDLPSYESLLERMGQQFQVGGPEDQRNQRQRRVLEFEGG